VALLKNSTRISYDFHFYTYILPKWGSMKLAKLRTIELQDSSTLFLLGLRPRRSPKYARLFASGTQSGKSYGN